MAGADLYSTMEDVAKVFKTALELHFRDDVTVTQRGYQWASDPKTTKVHIMENSSDDETAFPQVIYQVMPGQNVNLGLNQSGGMQIVNGVECYVYGGKLNLNINFIVRARTSLDRKILSDLMFRAVARKIRPYVQYNSIIYKEPFGFTGQGESVITTGLNRIYWSSCQLPVEATWRQYEPISDTVPITAVQVEATQEDGAFTDTLYGEDDPANYNPG